MAYISQFNLVHLYFMGLYAYVFSTKFSFKICYNLRLQLDMAKRIRIFWPNPFDPQLDWLV